MILSDTVGFISELPTTSDRRLPRHAGRGVEADVILHVRDISHAETDAQAEDVNRVLARNWESKKVRAAAIVEVWNKLDLLDREARAMREPRRTERKELACWSPQSTGEGLDRLLR